MKPKGMHFLSYDAMFGTDNARRSIAISIPNDEIRQWMLDLPQEEVVCLDVETTGLYPHDSDEVLQISICDGNGSMLLDTYVRPVKRRRWPNAQAIHGITWQMVKESPTLLELSDQIYDILSGCTLLIGYNIRTFDLEFLQAANVRLPSNMKVYDLIYDCAVLYGTWNDYYHNYTYVSLGKVAGRFGINYAAHSSSEDVIATTKVFYKLLDSSLMKSATEGHKTRVEMLDWASKAYKERGEASITASNRPRQNLRELVRNPQSAHKTSTAPPKHIGCLGWLVIFISASILLVLLASLIVQ